MTNGAAGDECVALTPIPLATLDGVFPGACRERRRWGSPIRPRR